MRKLEESMKEGEDKEITVSHTLQKKRRKGLRRMRKS